MTRYYTNKYKYNMRENAETKFVYGTVTVRKFEKLVREQDPRNTRMTTGDKENLLVLKKAAMFENKNPRHYDICLICEIFEQRYEA